MTRYEFTFFGSTAADHLAEGKGSLSAETTDEAYAKIMAFAHSQCVEPARIDLTQQRG
ncbi:hypothetical protein [Streptomyces fulvorobeus]|uniref:Uncharacterized protein n=1 Tax=Streptomyces fulvorobeus TaxID=284028 RepID=A0A7J0CFZ9_9ACTN|nr:hypothetical protein [Streptomyces fulvorobeus]NYE44849.1 hypothetical protein [Streptomyces fulvorobeus]GFN01433.1 hypothetical protein Sfulv_62430 [Streptomyces fulvorobeus]